MEPRDIPLEPRASLLDVARRRARLVGARTGVARRDLGLVPGVVSPYEIRTRLGLRYGDPPIEEARYERSRSAATDARLLARWALVTVLSRPLSAPETPTSRGRIRIVSAPVDPLDTVETIARIRSFLREQRSARVFFAHAHSLNIAARFPQLRADFERADLVLPDGIGLRVGATILGWRLPANVNGTDLVPELLQKLAADDIPIALIGGGKDVALRAYESWKTNAPVRLVGAWDGFGTDEDYAGVAQKISAASPCVVLIALGSPLQERFAFRFLGRCPGVVCITVGGLFDFASGAKPRAPLGWRELGLEWLWRLLHEPRRLAGRYLLGNPEFLARVIAQRMRHGRPAESPRPSASNAPIATTIAIPLDRSP